MSKKIETVKAPKAIGPYSQAVTVGDLVFTSGQIPLNPESGNMVGKDIAEQTHQVCRNLAAVLEASGASLKSVLKTTCYLSDMADFTAFNEVYASYFTNQPARSCVAVKTLPKSALVEIDAIAEREIQT